ncbi:hypothetical protein BCR42DRAFT_353038 [Absidia repens]|uniref:VASt domain-containing protein n=1 Tax=Absidia repens TaxID=90262 RepID=A0A1X2IGP5_9FUNG|nr:hypothetical protein BCR42DRAFT_353038 [Absidia repens]
MLHRRLHSNTVSGDRPLSIDTTSRPGMPRRNSEGSPGLPPEIDICAATPLESKQENGLDGHLSLEDFPPKNTNNNNNNNNSTTTTLNQHAQDKDVAINKSFSSHSLPTPVAAPEESNKHTLRIPTPAKKSRSRSSSQSSAISRKSRPTFTSGLRSRKASESESNFSNINGTPSASATQDSSRRGSDGTEDSVSEGEHSMAAGSIATAVRTDSVSDKRNQEFHALFRSVPEDDVLIEDYGCALQKEILVQGRIYISENYLCFNANIFGWVTNLVIAFSDIVDIEKRTTAIFIPNAIQISTLHAKHFFASFLSRDQAYDLMVDVWRYSRPLTNRSTDTSPDETLNSQVENGEEDSGLDEEDTSDLESDYTYSDTETEEDSLASPPIPLPSALPKNIAKNDSLRRRAFSEGAKRMLDDANAKDTPRPATPLSNGIDDSSKPSETVQPSSDAQLKAPSQQVNEKTNCVCGKLGEHYPNVVMDQTYSGSLEAFNNLLFTSDFMKRFLTDDEKSLDVDIGKWRESEESKKQVRKASYIKQLGGAIGPKQTQCLQTEEMVHSDMKESVTVLTTTQTPDVPSGSSFSVKTRTCLTWAGQGKVHMLVTVLVDFTKSSWLKSTIERASVDGQLTFYKHLDTAIQNYQKEHPADFLLDGQLVGKQKKKGKRRHRKHGKGRDARPKEEMVSDKDKQRTSWLDIITDGFKQAWNILPLPSTSATDTGGLWTTSQLTFICLMLMILANVYIAYKMKDVESRLNDIVYADGGSLPGFFSSSPSAAAEKNRYHVDDDSMENMYRDELWAWLRSLDVNQSDRTTNATVPPPSNAHTKKKKQQQHSKDEDEDPFDGDSSGRTSEYVGLSQQQSKMMLDQDLLALAKMIRRAERNIGQASRAMEKQRHRIEHHS